MVCVFVDIIVVVSSKVKLSKCLLFEHEYRMQYSPLEVVLLSDKKICNVYCFEEYQKESSLSSESPPSPFFYNAKNRHLVLHTGNAMHVLADCSSCSTLYCLGSLYYGYRTAFPHRTTCVTNATVCRFCAKASSRYTVFKISALFIYLTEFEFSSDQILLHCQKSGIWKLSW